MSTSQQSFDPNKQQEEEEGEGGGDNYEETYKKFRHILPTLPQETGCAGEPLAKYQGMWLTLPILKGHILAQHHFQPQATHSILLATFPKSGTTWFNALLFSIINRNLLEFSILCSPPIPMTAFPSSSSSSLSPPPRILATHIHYPSLPGSLLMASKCKIVYVFRNPKDVFISSWHFYNKLRPTELPSLSLQQGLELFCNGVSRWGSFSDQVLGYWNAGLESPNRFLFMSYERTMKEPLVCVKMLAEFLGQPFSLEEEKNRVIEETVKLCSFENLSNLEVNKTSLTQFGPEITLENDVLFRKGQVGDWESHLTGEMIERLDQITEQKFKGTGLMNFMISNN